MPEVRDQSLVCFSNIEWGIWKQRHHHLMERFARRNRVLFVETVGMRPPNLLSARDLRRIGSRLGRAARGVVAPRRSEDAGPDRNLRVHSPLVVPFHGLSAVRRFNAGLLLRDLRRQFAATGMTNPILWVYLPVQLVLDVAEQLSPRLLVYDCVDEITQFHDAPPSLARSEEALMRRADLIFATARPLLEKCRARNANTHYVPNAGDVEMFARGSGAEEPPDLAALPRPRVGYIGAIREWFDSELLDAAARRFPAAQFVLVGDAQPALGPALARPNVHVLGPRPYETLPSYLRGFDAALIPFRETELIRSTHPVKAYEYLAAGCPVVATPMDEINHLQEVVQARAGEEFLAALDRVLAAGRDAEGDARRRRSVEGQTWDARFAAIERALVEALGISARAAAEG